MSCYKFQTSVWADSALPRDAAIITPHVEITSSSPDFDAMAASWLAALDTWGMWANSTWTECKVYHDQAGDSGPPVGQAVLRKGTVGFGAALPREVALCLSFYSNQNVKSKRGRLYIPYYWFDSKSNLGVRPTSTQMNKVGALAPLIAAIGGAEDKWSVWSKKNNQSLPVTNWFVDDEWDTQRRRGLRSTTRVAASTTG